MKKKLLVIVLLLLVISVLSCSTQKADASIPFDGMSLTYYGNASGTFITKQVIVLRHNTASNTVTIRDEAEIMEVDLATREVLWATGIIGERLNETGSLYSEYWIPTDIEIGDVVKVFVHDAGVVDSAVLSVEGNPIEVWKLYVSYEGVDGGGVPVFGKETRYYEKNTGLWIATNWAEFYADGRVASSYGLHLASSNVAFSK
ncbi:MAG: hypothetical protein B6I38_10035 [Anaerolineaceae bacterium 4572_5.1]|nr:MAG: hypothetical protein B6I38_10035 [Anaerolineaceae bacterium 4572_5.1]